MSESGFNSAGAFSGGEAGGLKGGIEAAMKVMGNNANQQDHMPTEATPEIVDAAAQDVLKNAQTLETKNSIIKNHFNSMNLDAEKTTTQSIAAFEKAVMKKLGR